MTRVSALPARLLVALALAAGCAPAIGPTFPPQGATPAPPGDATAAAVNEVVRALGERGLQAAPSNRPYRPPEAARLAAAPRTIVQVTLPDDPGRGNIVVYALGSPDAALAAAEDQASYIASGPGAIQFPPDSRFVLRVVGSSVVFFAWSPASAVDPRTPEIAEALSTVGFRIRTPR